MVKYTYGCTETCCVEEKEEGQITCIEANPLDDALFEALWIDGATAGGLNKTVEGEPDNYGSEAILDTPEDFATLKEEYRVLYYDTLNFTTCDKRHIVAEFFRYMFYTYANAHGGVTDLEENFFIPSSEFITDILTAYKAFISQASCSEELTKNVVIVFIQYFNSLRNTDANNGEFLGFMNADLIKVIYESAASITGNPESLKETLVETGSYNTLNNFNPCCAK